MSSCRLVSPAFSLSWLASFLALDKLCNCACEKSRLEHGTKGECENFRLASGVDFVLYDLRHTFATRMIATGVDVMTLKEIMGHRDIRVTQKYVQPSQASQNEAMRLYDQRLTKRAGAEPLV